MIQLQVQRFEGFFLTGVLLHPCFSKVFRGLYYIFFLGVTGVLLCPCFSKVFLGLFCIFKGATVSLFL